jgi:hypothetical protein
MQEHNKEKIMSKKSSKKANKALTQNAISVIADEQVMNSAIDALFALEETEVAFVLEPTTKLVVEAPKKSKAKKTKTDVAVISAAQAPVHIITAPGEMGELMQAVSDVNVKNALIAINGEIIDRELFEVKKNPDNANIHKTIKKIKGSLERTHAATLMVAANVSPGFINRTLQDGSKYNVYAVLKVADLVDGLTGAGLTNAINIACMRSLFNFHKAGLAFTGEMAKAAASDKIRVSDAVKKHLIRHTVSASTAPTQASSTMQALQTLGVVRIEGSRKHPTYAVIDGPVTRRLKELADAYTGNAIEEEAIAA